MVVPKANDFDWEATIGKLTLKSINPNLLENKSSFNFCFSLCCFVFKKSFKLVYTHRFGWSRVGRGPVKCPAPHRWKGSIIPQLSQFICIRIGKITVMARSRPAE